MSLKFRVYKRGCLVHCSRDKDRLSRTRGSSSALLWFLRKLSLFLIIFPGAFVLTFVFFIYLLGSLVFNIFTLWRICWLVFSCLYFVYLPLSVLVRTSHRLELRHATRTHNGTIVTTVSPGQKIAISPDTISSRPTVLARIAENFA